MSNLSSIIILPSHSGPTSSDKTKSGEKPNKLSQKDKLTQAEMWARKAYDVLRAAGVGEANETGKGAQSKACDAALGATLFNLGMLREVGLPFSVAQNCIFNADSRLNPSFAAIERPTIITRLLHAYTKTLQLVESYGPRAARGD